VTEERVKRKLTAILSADVKGYSRLMGDDELATVRTLEAYREMISEVIRNYNGRVVDSPGDNLLAEFSSVVDAVESAVEIQNGLKAKNGELPEDRRMEFRIGINLGDVIEDGERIYGDGVNVAARIEGLAEGGGICISGTAFDQVETKLELNFEYLGEQAVKNIKKPVRVYRVKIPEQEYFSDGISEDIITALSQSPEMFVIARNSATTGHHLWAERYDRDLKDIFAIQDEITLKILKALQVKLAEGEQARLYAKGTENIEAYLKMGQARSYFYRFDRGSNLLARQICEEVISLAPNWELPYCVLGFTHWMDMRSGWSVSPEESIQEAHDSMRRL
jgi:adenylate cyclase